MQITGSAGDRALEVESSPSRPPVGASHERGDVELEVNDRLGWRTATGRWLASDPAPTSVSRAQVRADARLSALLCQPDGLAFLTTLANTVLRTDNERAAAASVGRLSHAIAPGGELDGVKVPLRDYLALALGGGFAPLIPSVGAWFGRMPARRYLGPLVMPLDARFNGRWRELSAAGGVRPVAAPVQARAIGQRQAELQLAEVERLIDEVDAASVALSLSAVARLGSGGLGSVAREQLIQREVSRLAGMARLARSTATQLVFEVDRHRDLELTAALVLRLLDESDNLSLSAAITLPIEFGDSFTVLQRLVTWADDRRSRGGAPLTVRFAHADDVAQDRADADHHGWESPAFSEPAVAWGNLQRMLEWVLTAERLAGLRVIVASELAHEHAFAWRLAKARGVARSVEHEFRHRVSPVLSEAVKRNVGGIRLRTAIVSAHGEGRAADYLMRRLVELHAKLAPDEIPDAAEVPAETSSARGARRVTDADPVSHDGRDWFDSVAGRVRARGATLGLKRGEASDGAASAPALLERAVSAAEMWAQRRAETRSTVVRSVAESIAHARTELVAIAMLESGMTVAEADHEVTEAIDLAVSAAESAETWAHVENAAFGPVSLTLALSPRNSPISTPAAQLIRALAAGSAVAIKPAPENQRSVAALVSAFRDGGVPDDLVALMPPVEDDMMHELMDHPVVERVVHTGSRHVAKRLRQWRPDLALLATTGGRNSIIVSESANVDRAVSDVVASAFHNAGQSPHSVGTVIVVGEQERFVSLLTDAVGSLTAGRPLDLATEVGALVRPATRGVLESLTTLTGMESWLVRPVQLDDEARLWSPGLVDGVAAGSSRHVAERRAPVLSIVRAESFDEALVLQNGPGFGVTAGLQSLDKGEIAAWLDSAEAGGLAVNLPVTGTLPSRHPVVGWNRSSVGLVRAAGGRLQLDSFGDWHPKNPAADESVTLTGVSETVAALISAAQPGLSFDEFDWVRSAARDDEEQWTALFAPEHERASTSGELSVERYRSLATTVRLAEGAPVSQLVRVLAAATRVHAPLAVSSAVPLTDSLIRFFRSSDSPIAEVIIESDARWHARVHAGDIVTRRIRFVGPAAAATALNRVLAPHATTVAISGPVTASGRVELANFLVEQAVRVRTL